MIDKEDPILFFFLFFKFHELEDQIHGIKKWTIVAKHIRSKTDCFLLLSSPFPQLKIRFHSLVSQFVGDGVRERDPIVLVDAAATVRLAHAGYVGHSQSAARRVRPRAYILPRHQNRYIVVIRMGVVGRVQFLLPLAEIVQRPVRVHRDVEPLLETDVSPSTCHRYIYYVYTRSRPTLCPLRVYETCRQISMLDVTAGFALFSCQAIRTSFETEFIESRAIVLQKINLPFE